MQNRAANEDERNGFFREFLFALDKNPADAQSTGYVAGKYCPKCKQAVLDYDGLLNVVCPNCGVVQGGCFT